MHTIWHSLAWREWHEHKWRLAALCAIMCALPLISLADQEKTQDVFGGVIVMALVIVGPLAIFIGAGTAAGERSRGTLPFLQALPVPMWRVCLHKLAFGLLTVVVPMVCLLLILCAWAMYLDHHGVTYTPPFSNPWPQEQATTTGHWLTDWGAVYAAITVSLFLWTVAAGSHRPDEISAGAVGLLWIVGLWTVGVVVSIAIDRAGFEITSPVPTWLISLGLAIAPGGMSISVRDRTPEMLAVAVVVALAVHVGLAAIFVQRFAGAMNLEARSPAVALRTEKRFDWLRPPFSTTWHAIAWKQMRESGPLILVGLAAIVAVVGIYTASEAMSHRQLPPPHVLVRVYQGIAMIFGVFISLVAGIGVALNDTTSKLNSFWRSRPVRPDLWFWTKYTAGLLLLLATIYGPAVMLAVVFHPASARGAWEHNLLLFPPLQVALFSTALALTCLVRNAIYAAILSIAVIYVSVLPAPSIWRDDYPEWDVPVTLLCTAAIMTIVGWLAMRNDWGWRR